MHMDRDLLYRNGRILNSDLSPGRQSGGLAITENEKPKSDLFMKPAIDPVVKSAVDTLHFWDGARRIDMVLAYRDLEEDEVASEDGISINTINQNENHDAQEERRKRLHEREVFEKNLKEAGLELEYQNWPDERSADGRTRFLKISCPWKLLTKYAEVLKLKMPIKVEDDEEETEPDVDSRFCGGCCFDSVPKMFDYDHTLIPEQPHFFTAGYISSKEDKFVVKDYDTFFTSAQRSLIVWQILMRTRYTEAKEEYSKRGIVRLLDKKTYLAAYPLHDGRYDKDGENGEKCARRILYLEWARWQNVFTNQPLWMIKRYFGDKIGLYFAWLGFYTKSLIFPTIIGILTVIYGFITVNKSEFNPVTSQICDDASGAYVGNNTMCPECETYCPYWKLKKSCVLSKVAYVFDNHGTVAFSIMMSVWAVIFLELWTRKQAVICWEWDLTKFEEDEPLRPQYESKVKTTRINPVTKKAEPYLPPHQKAYRFVLAYSFVIFMLAVVLGAVIAVMLYRALMLSVFYRVSQQVGEVGGQKASSYASLMVTTTATTINLLCIVIMNKLYSYVAEWLTNLECPRTFTDYEDSYTFKVFLFQFINYYSSLFYIAFFKGKFYKDPRTNKGFEGDECDPSGCFYELSLNLMIIMVGKQIINNCMEIGLPYLQKKWRFYVQKKRIDDEEENNTSFLTRWERDYNLGEFGRLGLLDEYLELAIQYGFITLFVAAFPLAPLFALINNIFEIRLDARKLLATKRRPLGQRAQDIGVWAGILRAITFLSVVTNGWTIAATSEFIPHLVYKYFEANKTADGSYSMEGYVTYSLSVFNTADWNETQYPKFPGEAVDNQNQTECYYKGLNDENYERKDSWWHVFAARLAFVLAFQHFIGMIASLIVAAVPDVPRDVKVQMHRENELEQQMLFDEGNGDMGQNNQKKSGNQKGFDPGDTMTAKEIPPFDQNSNPHTRFSNGELVQRKTSSHNDQMNLQSFDDPNIDV